MRPVSKHIFISTAVILLLSAALFATSTPCAHFELHKGLRDTICSDHATGTGIAVSVLACGNHCHVTNHCTGFFYNRGSRGCTMVKVIAIPQSRCLQEVGTNYYVKIVPDLFDGYDWTAADLALLATGVETQFSVCTSHPYNVVHTDLAATQTHGCPTGFTTCCKTKGCYPVSQNYTGTWSRTSSGRKCQAWDQQTPHSQQYYKASFPPGETYKMAANYCRDPGGKRELCTMDPAVEWGQCRIPRC